MYDDVRQRNLADREAHGFGLTIPRIAELLEAAGARQEDRTKQQAVAHGMAFSGKLKELHKMFPGRRKNRASEPTPPVAGERAADLGDLAGPPAADENERWMAEAAANFQPRE